MFGKKKKASSEENLENIDLEAYLADDEEEEEEIIEVESKGMPLRYKLLITLLVLFILFLSANYFLKNKCKITKFNIIGNTWYTEKEIIDAFKKKGYDDYSIFFKLHYTFGDMPKMAFVKEFTVTMDNLHTITIKVREKSIVGNVKIMDDYMYFDKDGMIIASRSTIMNNIPTIEGLIFTRASVGSVLEVQDETVFKDILEITQLIDKYQIKVDRIVFDKNVCVTLYCSDGNQIYIGRQKSYDVLMQAIPNILKAAEEKTATYKINMSEFTSTNTTIKAEFLTRPDEPVEPLPGEEPGLGNQPADNPGGNTPANPPADNPPANPPADNPPPANPPQDNPPQDNPPQDNPPQDNPPQDNPPAETGPDEPVVDTPTDNPPEENLPENPPAEGESIESN